MVLGIGFEPTLLEFLLTRQALSTTQPTQRRLLFGLSITPHVPASRRQDCGASCLSQPAVRATGGCLEYPTGLEPAQTAVKAQPLCPYLYTGTWSGYDVCLSYARSAERRFSPVKHSKQVLQNGSSSRGRGIYHRRTGRFSRWATYEGSSYPIARIQTEPLTPMIVVGTDSPFSDDTKFG